MMFKIFCSLPTTYCVFAITCILNASYATKRQHGESTMDAHNSTSLNYRWEATQEQASIKSLASEMSPILENETTVSSTTPTTWRIGSHLPFPGQAVSRCRLRPVNWANSSLGHVILLDRADTGRLFAQSRHRRIRLPGRHTSNPRLTPWPDIADHGDSTNNSWHPTSPVSSTTSSNNQVVPPQTIYLDCYVLFIYSEACPFSAAAWPYVRALARAHPQLYVYAVLVDDYVAHRWSLRMLFVPKIKLIVDGRIFREHTGSDTNLNELIDFVWRNIRQLPRGPIRLEPSDFANIPPVYRPPVDVFLLASWLITGLSVVYLVVMFGGQLRIYLQAILYRVSGGHLGKPSAPNTTFDWAPVPSALVR